MRASVDRTMTKAEAISGEKADGGSSQGDVARWWQCDVGIMAEGVAAHNENGGSNLVIHWLDGDQQRRLSHLGEIDNP